MGREEKTDLRMIRREEKTDLRVIKLLLPIQHREEISKKRLFVLIISSLKRLFAVKIIYFVKRYQEIVTIITMELEYQNLIRDITEL